MFEKCCFSTTEQRAEVVSHHTEVLPELATVGTLEIIANTATLSWPVPTIWLRVHLQKQYLNRHREDYIQGDSNQRYRGECNLLSL